MIDIFTDGSCDIKRQDGGWGFVAIQRATPFPQDIHRGDFLPTDLTIMEGSGGISNPGTGTSNRMELLAIYRAVTWLRANPTKEATTLFSDSSYAIHCITKWFVAWQRNGWINSIGKPVENRQRVEYILLRLEQIRAQGTPLRIKKIKGHRYYWNERADSLAGDARKGV